MLLGTIPVSSPGRGRSDDEPSSTLDVDKDLTLPKGLPPLSPRPAKGPRKGKRKGKGKEKKPEVKES
jgi:hypothetical protein